MFEALWSSINACHIVILVMDSWSGSDYTVKDVSVYPELHVVCTMHLAGVHMLGRVSTCTSDGTIYNAWDADFVRHVIKHEQKHKC